MESKKKIVQETNNTPERAAENDPTRLVPVYVFKGDGKYADDIVIGVNGKLWRIRRGRTVMVPYYVKAVLDNSMEQDRRSLEMQDAMQQESAEEYRRVGL